MAKGLNWLRAMTVRRLFVLLVFLASAASADWRNVAPGVDYQEYRGDNYDVHVTRINISSDQIRIVVSNESEKGLKVSDYAKKVSAVAAINGDYFDDHFNPVGYTIGPCGPWSNTKDLKREIVLQIANQHGVLRKRTELTDDPVDAAISGWPFIVAECHALGSKELPGSDAFTRSPHPRTALGISKDGTLLYFVVADGRRTGVPGLTLAQLADFMADKLNVCSAMNLDGGGSAAMWVGDHIAVVLSRDFLGCAPPPQQKTSQNR